MNITYSAQAHDAIWNAGVRDAYVKHVGEILGEDPRVTAIREYALTDPNARRWLEYYYGSAQ